MTINDDKRIAEIEAALKSGAINVLNKRGCSDVLALIARLREAEERADRAEEARDQARSNLAALQREVVSDSGSLGILTAEKLSELSEQADGHVKNLRRTLKGE